MFDSAERAVRAAADLLSSVQRIDLHVRAGVQTGEVERGATDVRGVAVHTAARIMQAAGPDEVMVSTTVRELLDGTDLDFDDAGEHVLKGLPGPRQLFRLQRSRQRRTQLAGAH
jgi:class 3 adenylate cyclase